MYLKKISKNKKILLYRFYIIALITMCFVTNVAAGNNLNSIIKNNLKTGIEGTVADAITKMPLVGATISINGTKKNTISDLDGKFAFSSLDSGQYTLSVSFTGYKSQQLSIIVEDNELKNVTILLEEETNNLNEVLIKSRKVADKENSLLRERRKSLSITDGISNELIAKTASITTTQALKKVAGVSVKDGNINIRGMSDRNIVVEVNGARLSGSSPFRPGSVSLDLIPAGMLETINIEKSVLPNAPGDATAGLVKLTTRSMPDSLVIQATAMLGFTDNIGVNGNRISFEGGQIGAFKHKTDHSLPSGFLDLKKQYPDKLVPSGIPDTSDQLFSTDAQIGEILNSANSNPSAFTEAQRINGIMEQFDPTLTTSVSKAPLNQLYSLYAANKFSLFGRPLGVGVGVNYYRKNQQVFSGTNNRYYSDNDLQTTNNIRLIPLFQYKEFSGTDVLNYGGMANMTFQPALGHEITLEYNTNWGNESRSLFLKGDPFTLFTSDTQALGDPLLNGTQALGGYKITNQSKVYQYQMQIIKKQSNSFQLRGKHKINNLLTKSIDIDWTVSQAESEEDLPDFKYSILTEDPNVTFAGRPETLYSFSTYRFFRSQQDKNKNAGFNIAVPIKLLQKELKFSTGMNYLERDRKFTELKIPIINLYNSLVSSAPNTGISLARYLLNPGGVPLGGNLNDLTNPNYIGIWETAPQTTLNQSQAGYIYSPSFTSPNNYEALSKVTAVYGMIDLALSAKLRIAGGIRVEDTDVRGRRSTNGIDPNNLDALGLSEEYQYYDQYVADQQQIDWLPSGTIIYNPISKMNIRLSASKTLARPDLFELIPGLEILDLEQQAFTKSGGTFAVDPQSGLSRLVRLKNATYENLDIRWEYFLRSSEVLAASFFGKRSKNQLEVVYGLAPVDVQNSLNLVDPRLIRIGERRFRNNPETGYLYGIELESRLELNRISTLFNNFLFGFNGSLINSYSKIAPQERALTAVFDRNAPDKRPLFEQPNYIVNLNLGYEKNGYATNLYFNQVGERLVEINSDGSPNLYERPAPELDFIFSCYFKFVKGLQFKFFAKNLLDQTTDVYYKNPDGSSTGFGTAGQNYVRRSINIGRDIMMGLTYKF